MVVFFPFCFFKTATFSLVLCVLTIVNWHGACLFRDNGFLPEVFTQATRFEQHIAFSLQSTSVLSLRLGEIIKNIAYFCPGSFEESVVI